MISIPKNSANCVLTICLQPPGNSDALLNLSHLEGVQKRSSRLRVQEGHLAVDDTARKSWTLQLLRKSCLK